MCTHANSVHFHIYIYIYIVASAVCADRAGLFGSRGKADVQSEDEGSLPAAVPCAAHAGHAHRHGGVLQPHHLLRCAAEPGQSVRQRRRLPPRHHLPAARPIRHLASLPLLLKHYSINMSLNPLSLPLFCYNTHTQCFCMYIKLLLLLLLLHHNNSIDYSALQATTN